MCICRLIKEESIKLHGTHDSNSVHCQFCEMSVMELHSCEMLAQMGKVIKETEQQSFFIMEVNIISQTHKARQSWLTLKTMHIYIFLLPVIDVYCIMCSFLGSNSESRILLDYFITSVKNQCKRNEWKFGRNASGLFMTALHCVHGHHKALMSPTDSFQFLTLKISVKRNWLESMEEMLEKMLEQLIRIS